MKLSQLVLNASFRAHRLVPSQEVLFLMRLSRLDSLHVREETVLEMNVDFEVY